MRLKVKTDGFRLNLIIPLCFAGIIIKSCLKKATKKLPEKVSLKTDDKQLKSQTKTVIKALREAKKTHGRLEILSVESDDGTKIIIKL